MTGRQKPLVFLSNLGDRAIPWCFFCGHEIPLYVERNPKRICDDCLEIFNTGPPWR